MFDVLFFVFKERKGKCNFCFLLFHLGAGVSSSYEDEFLYSFEGNPNMKLNVNVLIIM